VKSVVAIYFVFIRGYISLHNQRNLRLISSCLVYIFYSLLSSHYICRESSTNSPLFMQNKANLLDALMNASSAITMNYEQLTMNYANKNKPNSKPIKPKTNPIQTQNKPNTNPIRTQTNPIAKPAPLTLTRLFSFLNFTLPSRYRFYRRRF